MAAVLSPSLLLEPECCPVNVTTHKSSNRQDLRWLIANIDLLLESAIRNEDLNLASIAIRILDQNPTKVLAAASQSAFLQTLADEILTPDSPHPGLPRFASLIELCLTSFPSNLAVYLPFFDQFLDHAHNYAVHLMMKGLLTYQYNLKILYEQLIATDFVTSLIDRIIERKSGGEFEELSGLYEVFLLCLKNRKLRNECIQTRAIAVITDFNSGDSASNDLQWRLMGEIGNFGELNGQLFDEVSRFLSQAEVLTAGTVAAIQLWVDMLRSNPDFLRKIDVAGLVCNLKELCLRFPNHSIGLKAVIRLILIGMETSDNFADEVVPFVVEQIRNRKVNGSLGCAVVRIASRLAERGEDSEEFASRIERYRELVELCNGKVRQITVKMEEKYGGDLPREAR
jgi:hypothetical protein